jgi:transposase-like protein
MLFGLLHYLWMKQVLHSLVGCHLRGVFALLFLRHGAPMAEQELDLCKLIEQYGSEDRCRKYLEELRWPAGVRCVKCSSRKISRIYERNQFHCESCNHQFSVTAGTIFHDTHLPLWKWFLCTYLLCESRKGMSANQLKRTLGISYKTAWYLCHRIRQAMAEADGSRLKGTVNKTTVIGIRERSGHLHFVRTGEVDEQVLSDIIARNADKTVDVTMTDEARLRGFGVAQVRGKQQSIKRSPDAYVRYENGEWVTTNATESAVSLFKRGIVGTWHRVSVKHLPAYLNEMTWRFNNRKNPFLFRDTITRMLNADNLEFTELKHRRIAAHNKTASKHSATWNQSLDPSPGGRPSPCWPPRSSF